MGQHSGACKIRCKIEYGDIAPGTVHFTVERNNFLTSCLVSWMMKPLLNWDQLLKGNICFNRSKTFSLRSSIKRKAERKLLVPTYVCDLWLLYVSSCKKQKDTTSR